MTKWSSGNRLIGGIPQKYYDLLKDAKRSGVIEQGNDRPLKKRRTQRSIESTEDDMTAVAEKEQSEVDELSADSDSDDMWEQVNIDENQDFTGSDSSVEPLQIDLGPDKSELITKKRHVNVIPKAEKEERLIMHKLHLICLLAHVFIRNRWCNDPTIRKHYKRILPATILQELHPPSYFSDTLKTRKFLDGLRHAMTFWNNRFKVYSKSDRNGLLMLGWDQIYDRKRTVDRPIDLARFRNNYLLRFRGNRDMAAQGFCALLRSVNVETRLVVSLQPLDFTSNVSTDVPSMSEELDERAVDSRYPVFWIEAWNKYGKNWVTVDAIVLKLIDIVRRKSKMEPPISDKHNLLRYVIAFDRKGFAVDVTRRYANFYNAKTRKKRVTINLSGKTWWTKALEPYSHALDDRGIEELQYFKERETNEQIPKNIEDFKGHPMFVLEQHLKQKEILDPKTVCGQLAVRGRGKSTVVAIYSRKNVKELKSEVSWYRLGRVVKAGVQPMKRLDPPRKKRRSSPDDSEDESAGVPLFSEDQTEIYHPPAVVNGIVPKNRFGNIDIYTESMIPEGAVHLAYSEISIAARLIHVDYADAVTGFDFQGRRVIRPKIVGIVIAKEYKEAVMAVYEELVKEQQEEDEKHLILKSLMRWRRYLIALRIRDRLNKKHGVIEEQEANESKSHERMEEQTSESSPEIIESSSRSVIPTIDLSDSPLADEPDTPLALNFGVQKSDEDSGDENDIQVLQAIEYSLERRGHDLEGRRKTGDVHSLETHDGHSLETHDVHSLQTKNNNQMSNTSLLMNQSNDPPSDDDSGQFLAESMSESEL